MAWEDKRCANNTRVNCRGILQVRLRKRAWRARATAPHRLLNIALGEQCPCPRGMMLLSRALYSSFAVYRKSSPNKRFSARVRWTAPYCTIGYGIRQHVRYVYTFRTLDNTPFQPAARAPCSRTPSSWNTAFEAVTTASCIPPGCSVCPRTLAGRPARRYPWARFYPTPHPSHRPSQSTGSAGTVGSRRHLHG